MRGLCERAPIGRCIINPLPNNEHSLVCSRLAVIQSVARVYQRQLILVLHTGCSSGRPTNSLKALMASTVEGMITVYNTGISCEIYSTLFVNCFTVLVFVFTVTVN